MAEPDLPYAEVIGDPVDHSLSPVIHTHWLERLGIEAAYRRQHCAAGGLAPYLQRRRGDPLWRGCNVTMPLKEEAAALLRSAGANRIGAVNCIARRGDGLTGLNTDVDGVRAALAGEDMAGRQAVVIGAGGAARGAVAALGAVGAQVTILARSPAKAEPLRALAAEVAIEPLDRAAHIVAGAAAIINASPLGMAGSPVMPPAILAALKDSAPSAVAVEIVYHPLETPLLSAARASGLRAVDGLTILIGQARPAFEAFFGAPPPPGDAALRALLLRKLRAG